MRPFSVPVSLLRQYCFCPRIPFFYLVKDIKPVAKPWEKQGVIFHKRQCFLNARRRMTRFGLSDATMRSNQLVSSELLYLHGVCDSILFSGDSPVAIVEFKSRDVACTTPGSLIQLTAYSMILEDLYNITLRQGFFLCGERGKVHQIDITNERKEQVLLVRDSIYRDCERSLLPHSCVSEFQCGQCEFINFCADR